MKLCQNYKWKTAKIRNEDSTNDRTKTSQIAE